MTELIAAATDQLETDTRRALVTQTWDMYLDRFPVGNAPIELRKPPVQSITELKYLDLNNQAQTIDPSNYYLQKSPEPGAIYPINGYKWPETSVGPDSVSVTMVCGYGVDSTYMPPIVTQAIKLHVTMSFSENEDMGYERRAFDALANRLGWGGYP